MKHLIIISSFFLSSLCYSQSFYNRTLGTTTPNDPFLSSSRAFYMPRLNDTTLSGGLDSIGALMYDRLRSKLAIRDTITGGHKWTFLFKQDDTIATLATKYDLSQIPVIDTVNKWINDIRRRSGTDTVEKFKNGSWQFAFTDTSTVPSFLNFNSNYAEQDEIHQAYQWSMLTAAARSTWWDGITISDNLDTLFCIGGWNTGASTDSVFYSADRGATWVFRSLFPYAVHTPVTIKSSDGYTYIIGGDYLNNNTQRATVTRTRNFLTYETRTTSSPFGTRVLHAGVEFNGELYVGGGQYYTLNRADGLFTDMYKSTDGGMNWTLVSNSLAFMGKNISGCLQTFNGRIWLVTGGIYDNVLANKTFNRSTYSTYDGVNWMLGDSIPFSGFQYPNTFVWDGKLWISGGFSGSNVDSTAFMDKSGRWHLYMPSIRGPANHAAGMYVFKDEAYKILGNGTNQVWRLRRSSDSVFYENKVTYRTGVAFDTIRRNSWGYNIDAWSPNSFNEDRYVNLTGTNREVWSGITKQLYNNNILTWEFPASGQFYAKQILASTSSTTFYSGAYYSTSLQTTQTFPGIAWSGASNRFVLGLDGSLVGFRLENGATNGIRMKHDISNGQTVIATNSTNNYDVATIPSAALGLISTTHGFLAPVMTGAQRNAITVGRITGLSVTNGGSGYTNGSYTNVALLGGSGSSATASITVSGGVLSSATITLRGTAYLIGDVLTVNAAQVGGTGSGGQITVSAVNEDGLFIVNNETHKLNYYNGVSGWKPLLDSASVVTLYTGDGSLSGDRIVTGAANSLTFTSTRTGTNSTITVNNTSSGRGINVSTGSGIGVRSVGTTGIGLQGVSTDNYGVWSESTNAPGLYVLSTASNAADMTVNPTSTNTVVTMLKLIRSSQSAGADGIGQSIDFNINNTAAAGTTVLANQIISKLTTATSTTETSQLQIKGRNAGSATTIATFDGNANVTFGTTNSIVGTATNNDAVAGNIGEEVNSTVSTYTNYTTTATYQNITSITLTAGDWDLSAFFTYSSNSATITGAANAIFVISTTTASAAGATEGKNIAYLPQAALLGTSLFSDAISPYRVSLSGTTTYYLNTQATFTVGNPQYVGGIRARRVR